MAGPMIRFLDASSPAFVDHGVHEVIAYPGTPTKATLRYVRDAYREMPVHLIEPHALFRESLVRGLAEGSRRSRVVGCADLSELLRRPCLMNASPIVIISLHDLSQSALDEVFCGVSSWSHGRAKIVVLGGTGCDALVRHALTRGARGFIPLSQPMQVAIEVVKLVQAGGTCVPASLAILEAQDNSKSEARPACELFTPKQMRVLEGLRHGKANKAIAYDLNMCENTVKVHVRAIMQKLGSRNRTEVALKIERLKSINERTMPYR